MNDGRTYTGACKMGTRLSDLLLDPASASAEDRQHLEACADCRTELAELERTMRALDSWTAPEPSPFFETKLRARLREERAAPPAGFLERWRTRLLFSSNLHPRPLVAGVLTAILTVGGGTALWLEHGIAPPVQESATVRDLQSLDGNAQVFQQLSALDSDEDDGSSTAN